MRVIVIALFQIIAYCLSVAAGPYPERAVTIAVPYAAGGGIDVVSRMLGQRLNERLGQPFVVENRLGAGGVIATSYVAKAPNDGYTLLMGSDAQLAIQVSLRKTLPYDSLVDFAPITIVGSTPFALLVNPSLPVASVGDLIKLAKAKPGELTYGSSGIGGTPHLVTEMFMSMSGTKMRQIPYKGTSQALNDVVAGRVNFIFSGLTGVVPLLREGKLRALGVSSPKRVAILPEVPSVAEAGIPGFDAVGFVMLVAPAGTSKDIITKLHNELKAIVTASDMRQRYESIGYITEQSPPPDELNNFIKRQIRRWGEVIERAGLLHSQ
jgi:tripartite-type tricarboxylate transporter receptor subunit TctC